MDSELKLILGDVIVTKFPCTHPGDIRKLKAVKNEQLKDIYDVIVFPKKGSDNIPEQVKMANGDLDGDIFVAIWDKSIVSQVVNI